MRTFFEKTLKDRIAGYKREERLINSEYNREKELARAYKGREILELIQNAEDELIDDLPKSIYISFDGKVLRVSNYGKPFSEDGVGSLMYSNDSDKGSRKKKVIGNKGTGFRSILGWADEIQIDSGELHIKFSDKRAQDVLRNEVYKNGKVPKGKKSAILTFPEWNDKSSKSEYTTDIRLTIKDDGQTSEDIRSQLEGLNENLLLFLNYTQSLVVALEDHIIKFEKEVLSDNRIRLIKIDNDEVVYSKEWMLNRKNGAYGDEHYTIVIAYDGDNTIPDNPYIYTYFQTDVRFPFPVLLHSDFNLNGDRNHLNKNDPGNKQILEDVAELLVDTAIRVYDKGVSYNRLLFLIPDSRLDVELEEYDFWETLKEKIRKAELFPTVNSRYVVYDKELKFYTSEITKYLSGTDFSDLLMYSDYTQIDDFLEELSYSRYSYAEMAAKVGRWVEKRKATNENIRKIAFTAVRFLDEYGDDWAFDNYIEQRPKFFFNTDRKLIPSGVPVFLVDEEYKVSNPPRFANVEFMDPYMRNYFYKKLKEGTSDDEEDVEILINKLGAYNVKEYNSEELISHMNEVIQSKIDAGKLNDAKKRWKTFIKWLWNNRLLLLDEGTKYSIFFLTRSDAFGLSSELYYGIEYGNELCEELIGTISPQYMICDLHGFIEGNNSEIEEFLRLFDVESSPRMRVETHNEYTGYYGDRCSQYIRTLFKKLTYPVVLDTRYVFKDLDEFCLRVKNVEIQRNNVDLLEEILESASTEAILKWIQLDNRLQNHLYTGLENEKLTVRVLWGDMREPRPLASMDRPYSYIHYLFSTIPWIEVNEKRYCITDCILGLDSCGLDLSEFIVEPNVSEYIKNISGPKGKIKKEYQGIFEKLNVKSNLSDLPLEKLYSILNALPQMPDSEVFAKRLYNAIIENKEREYSDDEFDCDEYNEFIEGGQILTNNGYRPISESYYLDGKDVCDKVAHMYNLIVVPKKRNKKRIKKMLGVEQLLLEGSVIGKPVVHPENDIFKSNLRYYKVLAFVYRINDIKDIKNEARLFRDIEIIICKEIRAQYSVEEDDGLHKIELDDYEYILDGKNTYYLKVPYNLEYRNMQHNMLLASAIANIFSSYLGVNEIVPEFRELYYIGDNEERRTLIEQEYEDTAIIKKSSELLSVDEDIKDEFVRIICKLSGKTKEAFVDYVNSIDFDNFSAEYNVGPLIDILRFAEINVDDFNSEMPPITINLTNYYQKEVQNAIPLYQEQYKTTWYNKLQYRDVSEKINLVDNFLLYNDATIRVENDVFFDVRKAIIEQLEIDMSLEIVELAGIYKQNLECWKGKQSNIEHIDDFLIYPENMSLIYYGEYDELDNNYHEFCDSLGDLNSEEILREAEEEKVVEVFHATAIPVKTAKSKSAVGNTTGYLDKKPKKETKKVGFEGEKLVYEHLLEDERIQQVNWVSENAKKAGINPEGRASLGYDMDYIDSEGRRKYVEVKSTRRLKEDGVRFYMSDHEFEFGERHAEDYQIYYVSNIRGLNPQILIFDNLFINNSFNKKCFSFDVESKYTIMAEARL